MLSVSPVSLAGLPQGRRLSPRRLREFRETVKFYFITVFTPLFIYTPAREGCERRRPCRS